MMTKTVLIIFLVVMLLPISGCKHKEPERIVFIQFGELMDQDYNVSSRIKELNGKEISMTGFMAMQSPLDGSFIYLTNAPLVSCPYCIPGTNTPIYAIPAIAPKGKPINYTEQPITVTGVLEVKDKTDEYGYMTPFRIIVDSLSIADASSMTQSLKEYMMLSSDGVVTDVLIILDQLIAYVCYDLSALNPDMIYTINSVKIDGLINKVKGYGVASYNPLIDILQRTRDLSIEVNHLIENDKTEEMINYSEEGSSIWYAYFAWANEMASLE